MKRILRSGEHTQELAHNTPPDVRVERLSNTEILLWRGASAKRFAVAPQKNGDVFLAHNGESFTFRVEETGRKRSQESESALSSPMPGKVIRVNKQVGDAVEKGEAIVVVEAMKMELPLKAPRVGIIKKISCALGERVAAGAVVVELE